MEQVQISEHLLLWSAIVACNGLRKMSCLLQALSQAHQSSSSNASRRVIGDHLLSCSSRLDFDSFIAYPNFYISMIFFCNPLKAIFNFISSNRLAEIIIIAYEAVFKYCLSAGWDDHYSSDTWYRVTVGRVISTMSKLLVS